MAGLKNASKKAIQQGKLKQLDSLGTSKDGFEAVALSAVEQALGEFISRIHANLDAEGMIVSGKIADIELRTEGNSVQVLANPWLLYQDKGVSGTKKKYNTPYAYTNKRPPVDVFKQWIKEKNIQLRDNKKYYGPESSFKDLTAWAISTKVYQEGLKPRNVFSRELPELIESLTELVGQVAVNAI